MLPLVNRGDFFHTFVGLSQVRYMSSTDAKVEQMFQILLDPQEKGTEKKQKVWGLD